MDEVGRTALKPGAGATGVKARLSGWIFQPRGPEAGEVFLAQRRVFIFPTRYGLFFAFSLLVFLAASINYDLALGFVLTFYLASAGLVAMLHTFRNQVHLRLRPLRADPVFAGGRASFEVLLDNRRKDERAALWLATRFSAHAVDLPPRSAITTAVVVPAPLRGWLAAPRITVDTRYPLGLFRAWSYWQPALECLVYPAPATGRLDLPELPDGNGEGVPRGTGTDDFAGLREYQITDSPRHIAWKAAARAFATGAPLPAKLFSGSAAAELVFDLAAQAPNLDLETRLSRLARHVIDADALHLTYTLRLGPLVIGPDDGEAQRLACLKALALHQPLPRGR
jgi:uncharacterized protein (DUF58 family)